jgi:hypothetical protein
VQQSEFIQFKPLFYVKSIYALYHSKQILLETNYMSKSCLHYISYFLVSMIENLSCEYRIVNLINNCFLTFKKPYSFNQMFSVMYIKRKYPPYYFTRWKISTIILHFYFIIIIIISYTIGFLVKAFSDTIMFFVDILNKYFTYRDWLNHSTFIWALNNKNNCRLYETACLLSIIVSPFLMQTLYLLL